LHWLFFDLPAELAGFFFSWSTIFTWTHRYSDNNLTDNFFANEQGEPVTLKKAAGGTCCQ
jgi:hypothetical protein